LYAAFMNKKILFLEEIFFTSSLTCILLIIERPLVNFLLLELFYPIMTSEKKKDN
jgi:hypothetical protein